MSVLKIDTHLTYAMTSDIIVRWFIVRDQKNNVLENTEFLTRIGAMYSWYSKSNARTDFPTAGTPIKILKAGRIRIPQFFHNVNGIIGKPKCIRRTISYTFGKSGRKVQFDTAGDETTPSVNFGSLGRIYLILCAQYENGNLIEESDAPSIKPAFSLVHNTYFTDVD